MAETTATTITDLPEYQREYLQEILQRAQALGKQAYTLPEYQVAGRTPIQQQATDLAHKVLVRICLCYRQENKPRVQVLQQQKVY